MGQRIVFLRSNPVAPDPRVEKAADSLIRAGHSVTVVCWDRSRCYRGQREELCLRHGRVNIWRVGIPASFGGGIRSNLLPLLWFQLYLWKWLFFNRKQYDVIHACDFDTALIACCFAKLFGRKLVYDIFDEYTDAFGVPQQLKKTVRALDHAVINRADAVILCTEERKNQIAGASPARLTVIHNTPPVTQGRAGCFQLNKKAFQIVYVGILKEERFLREIADVVREHPDYELHIGGFGELSGYLELLSQSCPNLFFYGRLSYCEALALENQADVIAAVYDPAVPNHAYAAPNKFYEALMLGKPIIMAKNTGMSELVQQYEMGETIEYNRESLRLALAKLSAQSGEWSKRGETLKKLYQTHFSWNRMEKRLLALYEGLAENGEERAEWTEEERNCEAVAGCSEFSDRRNSKVLALSAEGAGQGSKGAG